MYWCDNCNKECEIEVKKVIESYLVKDKEIETFAKVSYCKDCGNEIFNEELDNQTLKAVFSKYRVNHGLLQPEEIKQIREECKMSQKEFAKFCGLNEKIIKYYENGSIQEECHNRLFLLIKENNEFKKANKPVCSFLNANNHRSLYDYYIFLIQNQKELFTYEDIL